MDYLKATYGYRKETPYPRQLMEYLNMSGIVVELGSGTGIHLKILKELGCEATGIDKANGVDLEYEMIPTPSNFADYVYSKSLYEHIKNTDNLVRETHRILKPGGKTIILTPAFEYNYRWFYNDYTHIKPLTKRTLYQVLEMYNFKDVKVEYLYQLPLVWKYPCLMPIVKLLALLPDKMMWKDLKQTQHRIWIRFSKEPMLLATGVK